MSMSAIQSAFSAQLGDAGSLVNASLNYLDGGRLQFLALTIVAGGKRQTITRTFQGGDDLIAGAKQMALDFIAGTLKGV